MEKLRKSAFGVSEERVAWEGLAASCTPPIRRLGAFLLVGFAAFITLTSAVVLFYNVFGERRVEGQGVSVPAEAFYITLALSFALALGGFFIWLTRSLRNYASFADLLRRGGLDPKRPTLSGLRAYPDEQLLALRSRYGRAGEGMFKDRLERVFGFHPDDSFSLAPLSVRPDTFETNALRVEWETNLILRQDEPMPEISWWTEGRTGLLPRQPNETRRLVYALRYTTDSVRELKRRYGYRTDHWHTTVPEGQLFDALRDLEDARRIRTALSRKPRHT
ncbi:MAG: hypothetical protein WA990_14965 [Rubrobacteraceae bacterium]